MKHQFRQHSDGEGQPVPTDRKRWVLLTGWLGLTGCTRPGTGFGNTRSHPRDPPDHPVEISNEIPPTSHKVRNPKQRPPSPGSPPPTLAVKGGTGIPGLRPCFPPPLAPLHLLGKEQRKTFRSYHTRNLAGHEDTSRPPASQSRRTCVLLPAMLTSPETGAVKRSRKKEEKERCITRARFTRKHRAWWQCINVITQLGTGAGVPLRRPTETALHVLFVSPGKQTVLNKQFKNTF